MRNKKTWFLIITSALAAAVIAHAARISDNNVKIGQGSSNRTIEMGDGRLIWNGSNMQFSNDAGSSVKNIGSGAGGAAGTNLLADNNFDFEGSFSGSWTASGGGSIVPEQSTPLFGSQSGVWDPSAASETLDSVLVTVIDGLEGRNCSASIEYLWDSGSAGDIELRAVDSGGSVLNTLALEITTGVSKTGRITFPCPSNDSIRLRLFSTADAAAITVDNAFLGENLLTQISQSTHVASAHFVDTTNCVWSRTGSTSFGAFSTDTDCPAITVDLTGGGVSVDTTETDLPEITLNNLAPGRYFIIASFSGDNTNDQTAASFGISDGTTRKGDTGLAVPDQDVGSGYVGQVTTKAVFEYTSGQSSRTFSIHGLTSNSGENVLITNNGNGRTLSFEIFRFSLDSQSAITSEQQGWYIDANIGGANPSLGTSNVSTYTGITDSGLDLVLNTGSQSAEIACASTEASSGLTCTGDESVGLSFTIPRAGIYEVCGQFTHGIRIDSNGDSIQSTFQWVETPNNAQTISQEGKGRVMSSFEGEASAGYTSNFPHNLCGILKFSSVGKKTVRVFYEQLIGNTPVFSRLQIERLSTVGQRDMHVTVRPLVNEQLTPLLVNSVISSFSGVTRDEIVKVNCQSSSSILSEHGSWVASIGNISTGACVLTLDSGIFSATPDCVASGTQTSTPVIVDAVASSATSVTVDCVDDVGGDCTDYNATIQCKGAN